MVARSLQERNMSLCENRRRRFTKAFPLSTLYNFHRNFKFNTQLNEELDMNSKERMRRAVNFETPDRIPLDPRVTGQAKANKNESELRELFDYLNSLPVDNGKFFDLPDQGKQSQEENTWSDAWGCLWKREIPGEFGTVIESPLEDPDKLDDYVFPDLIPAFAPARKPNDDVYQVIQGADRYGVLWYQMQFLRGYKGIMMDLAADLDRAILIRDKILEKRIVWLEKALESRPFCDAVHFGDCWGVQNALMISPDQWREIFKPAYKRLFDVVRDAGKKVYFQSDGHTLDIIPDLVEIGVDILRVSVGMMDIEALGDMIRGKACLWCDPCRQKIIPRGTPDEVRAHIQRIIDAVATPEGGLIGGLYIDEDVPVENVKAAYETYLGYR